MSLLADLRILWHLTLAPARGRTHADRLEAFYARQADGYDDFRARLLPGRGEMYRAALETASPEPLVWLDLGGGTGANIEHLANSLPKIEQLRIVDLSSSLLAVADRRIRQRGWTNVRTQLADVTTLPGAEASVDVVTLSYALTMIPDWHAAIDRAMRLLKPGGVIGVVDFYVSHKHPPPDRARHGWWTRTFWPAWFAFDNVFLSPDILAMLERRFARVRLTESRTRLPYMPGSRVPYYTFVGVKR
jgi:S-adenosylmethionine-diacylgycerolhomoserine-N-methlytransferase